MAKLWDAIRPLNQSHLRVEFESMLKGECDGEPRI